MLHPGNAVALVTPVSDDPSAALAALCTQRHRPGIMRIAVAGLGHVGLSNAGRSAIVDRECSDYLSCWALMVIRSSGFPDRRQWRPSRRASCRYAGRAVLRR